MLLLITTFVPLGGSAGHKNTPIHSAKPIFLTPVHVCPVRERDPPIGCWSGQVVNIESMEDEIHRQFIFHCWLQLLT